MKQFEKCTLPVKYASFLENISKIDVGIQEVWVECHSFLKVMNCQPDFSLGIEDTSEVAPSDGKVWSRLNCLQVASLNNSRRNGRGYQYMPQERFHAALYARLARRCLNARLRPDLSIRAYVGMIKWMEESQIEQKKTIARFLQTCNNDFWCNNIILMLVHKQWLERGPPYCVPAHYALS